MSIERALFATRVLSTNAFEALACASGGVRFGNVSHNDVAFEIPISNGLRWGDEITVSALCASKCNSGKGFAIKNVRNYSYLVN